jgi:biotin operon repressor
MVEKVPALDEPEAKTGGGDRHVSLYIRLRTQPRLSEQKKEGYRGYGEVKERAARQERIRRKLAGCRLASAKEIAAELGISVPDAAHHIGALYKDGVAEYVKTETGGSRRNAPEHFYRATALPEVTEADWLKMPHDCRRQMAGRVLQAIVALGLSAMRCQAMETDDNLNLGWQAVPVDDEGEIEAAELLAETSKQAMQIKARNQKRLAKTGKEGAVRIIATMGFYQPDPGTWPGRLRDSQ